MARGEKPTPESNAIGVTVVAVFGVAALGAVLFVILATHACATCEGWLYSGMGAVPTDPYMGASTAASQLHWRDTDRRRVAYGAEPPLDGTAAHSMVDPTLRSRGYLPSSDAVEVTLPADVTVPELDRSCGVLSIQGDATARLSGAGRGTALRSADDPSLLALGTCGVGPYRIEGTGTAWIRAYLMPGLVTGDVERTELPEDVLLAHAEAETLLRSLAYTPSDQVLRIDITSSSGAGTLMGLPEPATGCVPWAVVLVGAGMTQTDTALPAMDYAVERGMALAVTCAGGTGTSLTYADAGGDGLVAWARPYSAGGMGASPTTTLRTADLRVVDEASLVLPTSVPSASPP